MMQMMSALLLLLLRLLGKSNMVAHLKTPGWDVFAVHVSTKVSALITRIPFVRY